MSTNYSIKKQKSSQQQQQKQKNLQPKKNRINWSQSHKKKDIEVKKDTKKKVKKALQYALFLKTYNYFYNYKDVEFLTPFLTKYGKIRPRRKTRLTVQQHHQITKTIRKARALGVIPFSCNVIV